MSENRTILGLDPSTQSFGVALLDFPAGGRPVVRFFNVIRPAQKQRYERLAWIGARLEAILQEIPRPSIAASESGYVGKNPQGALAIAEARGVGMAACGRFEIEVVQVSPSAGKRAVSGKGLAKKEEVGDWITELCDLPGEVTSLPEDAADAAAVAISAAIDLQLWARPAAHQVNQTRRRKRATSVDEFVRLATRKI